MQFTVDVNARNNPVAGPSGVGRGTRHVRGKGGACGRGRGTFQGDGHRLGGQMVNEDQEYAIVERNHKRPAAKRAQGARIARNKVCKYGSLRI